MIEIIEKQWKIKARGVTAFRSWCVPARCIPARCVVISKPLPENQPGQGLGTRISSHAYNGWTPRSRRVLSLGTIESMMGRRGSTYRERRDGVMVSRMVDIIIAGIAGQTNIAGLTWQEYMWHTCDIAGLTFELLMMISLVFCLINMRFQ